MKTILHTGLAAILLAGAVALVLVLAPLNVPASAPAPDEPVTGGPGAAVVAEPAVQVVADAVQIAPVRDEIVAVGDLRADEAVVLRPEIAGVIRSIHFQDGDRVTKGSLLFAFDDQVLRAELDDAQANLDLSHRNYERARDLLEKRIGPERSRDEALASWQSWQAKKALAEARLDKARIHAPFDGIVGFRQVSPGAYVQAGQDLVRLVRSDPIQVDFQVPERFLEAVAPGQTVSVSIDALPGRSFAGQVHALDNVVDVNGRAIAIRARIDNRDGLLRPGLFARVTLITQTREQAVVVPDTAIVPEAEARFVFVVDGGTARKTQVEIGRRVEGRVEVVSGLKAGDVVVTVGQQKIRDGSPVTLVALGQSS